MHSLVRAPKYMRNLSCASGESRTRKPRGERSSTQKNIPRQSPPPAKTMANIRWWRDQDWKIAEEIENGEW